MDSSRLQTRKSRRFDVRLTEHAPVFEDDGTDIAIDVHLCAAFGAVEDVFVRHGSHHR